MKNMYRWLLIILNAVGFIFMAYKIVNNAYYFDEYVFGISLVILFIINDFYVICSGSGWLPLYIKRKSLEEEKRIEELLQKEVPKSSGVSRVIRWPLFIGNILGLVFSSAEYEANWSSTYYDTNSYYVFATLFVLNIFYIPYSRIYIFHWLLLTFKRKSIEEEKIIKELKR